MSSRSFSLRGGTRKPPEKAVHVEWRLNFDRQVTQKERMSSLGDLQGARLCIFLGPQFWAVPEDAMRLVGLNLVIDHETLTITNFTKVPKRGNLVLYVHGASYEARLPLKHPMFQEVFEPY
jgi:hypothetical protein